MPSSVAGKIRIGSPSRCGLQSTVPWLNDWISDTCRNSVLSRTACAFCLIQTRNHRAQKLASGGMAIAGFWGGKTIHPLKKVTEASSASVVCGKSLRRQFLRRRIGRLQGAHLGVTRQQQVDVCCSCQRRIDAFIKYERHGDKRQWVTSSNALALPFAATEHRERALFGSRRAAGNRNIQYADSAGDAQFV